MNNTKKSLLKLLVNADKISQSEFQRRYQKIVTQELNKRVKRLKRINIDDKD